MTFITYKRIFGETKSHTVQHRNANNSFCRYIICCTLAFVIVALLLLAFTWTHLLLLSSISSNKDTNKYASNKQLLVCYYDAPPPNDTENHLNLTAVPGALCTHINIGIASLRNATLVISPQLDFVLQQQLPQFRQSNPQVKVLLWIGGADSGASFALMVANHAHRKQFLRSLKYCMRKYALDGVDLDWEFPSAYDKERQHLTQLLYEIRQEWQREHKNKDYILSLAVAAPEGIAIFAYDIGEFNKYVNHINLMTYDFHFYAKQTPFTGLNAPLYARKNETSILATININYTVHWWLNNGLDAHRLVVGLPTYGHSFRLVNPFNTAIGAPSSGYGNCGRLGFTTYSDTCHCAKEHVQPIFVYDNETCSPYLTVNGDWISYENKESIKCKTEYVKALNVGGVMVYSLNTDDVDNLCDAAEINSASSGLKSFPLINTVREILYSND